MYIKQEIGKQGEEMAVNYLKDKNYEIIQRNFRSKQGEIDIIAWDIITCELVFFEVKTRTNYSYGKPAEAITNIKQKHIYKTAKYYVYYNKIKNVPIRFDVMEINLGEKSYTINHIKQAIIEEYY